MDLRRDPLDVQRVERMVVALVVLILGAALIVQTVRSARADAANLAVRPDSEPVLTFVSAPDLLNADLGDLRTYPGWQPGMPNSFSQVSSDSLDLLFREIGSWDPDAVLVAGDLVRGHWDVDGAGAEVFGPVDTRQQRLDAIRRAGDFYYPVWRDRFTRNGIDIDTVMPALGDHEIGDNPWPSGSFDLEAVPVYKRLWAEHFTVGEDGSHRFAERPVDTQFQDTAYATYLAPSVLLVTVDTFAWGRDELRVDVTGKQLEWLRGVLEDAPDDATILVQGHVPVLTPVRVRGSSALHLDYGGSSAFWRLLEEHGVRLYLNGEVHDFTATQLRDGQPVQLSHGGLFAHGTTNYVVGRVYADGRVTLDARQMRDRADAQDQQATMWQTRNPIQGAVRFRGRSVSVGTMTIDGQGHVVERSGMLAPYDPPVGQVWGRSSEE